MGSGCNKNSRNSGACNGDQVTSSHCVNWQGASYPNLNICVGDTLSEVGEFILSKLISLSKAEGITVSDLVSGCDDLDIKLKNSDSSLHAIFSLILEEQCSIEDAIKKLNVKVEDSVITVDASKLCPDAKTISEVQQCVIDNVVSIKKSLENLSKNLGNLSSENNTIVESISRTIGDFLLSNLKSCNAGIETSGTGKNATINLLGINPPGAYIWGEFDISKFDSTGLGTDIYCGYALANGRNGTIDMRNRIPSMAAKIQGVTKTFDYLTNYGDIQGLDKITLNSSQIPNHEHVVDDPGHDHEYAYQGGGKQVGKNSGGGETAGATNNVSGKTSNSKTGITVGAIKGVHSQPVDVRQNTVYLVWVKRVSGFSQVATQNSQFNINSSNNIILNE